MKTEVNAMTDLTREWPPIFDKYVEKYGPSGAALPHMLVRRYHGNDVSLWYGRVDVNDVEGWVENIRLTHYLNQWRQRRGDPNARPTTEEIYSIMLEADREERTESRKPFHIERLARNIAANGLQEPIFIAQTQNSQAGTLWDGNRRRYASKHILITPGFEPYRESARWIPAYVYVPTGDPQKDHQIKHAVLTELNFKEKDHIPWPTYVKAEQIYNAYQRALGGEAHDPAVRRESWEHVANEYGLKGWRTASRWVRMYELAMQFKEYHVEEHDRDETQADLKIQEHFEYFDELTKPGVLGAINGDPEAREEIFQWLWDDKFKAFVDVRSVPRILADPVARRQANAGDADGVKRAIATTIANDPVRIKDKEAANEKIRQFAEWLRSFRLDDYRQIEKATLVALTEIVQDVKKMLQGLLDFHTAEPKVQTNVDENV
jgi:hypothetical protein